MGMGMAESARQDTVLRYYEERAQESGIHRNPGIGYPSGTHRDREAVPKPWFRSRPAAISPKAAPSIEFHPIPLFKTLTPAEIRVICLVMLVLTAVAIGMILMAAQAAVIQQEINGFSQEIVQTEKDIVNLKVDIEQAQNIESIRSRAANDFGMKEPAYDQYVYVSDLPEPEPDFARFIKERAYGTGTEQSGPRSAEQEPQSGE
jgi:cell division protein FtsL